MSDTGWGSDGGIVLVRGTSKVVCGQTKYEDTDRVPKVVGKGPCRKRGRNQPITSVGRCKLSVNEEGS